MISKQIDNPVILITVYDRPDHIKQCIESIESAHNVEAFHIIIGSDYPAESQHTQKIDRVRAYLRDKKESNKFGGFCIVEHQSNVGERQNFKAIFDMARKMGFKSFIHMEDDIIVGHYFLDFITNGLNCYRTDEKVFAIRGFRNPEEIWCQTKAYTSNRFTAYGYGSWFDKWTEVQQMCQKNNYAKMVLSKFYQYRKFSKYSANAKSLPFMAEGLYWAGDIELGLMMAVEDKRVLCAPKSLTANRGMDGTGLRSGRNPQLQVMKPCDERFEIVEPKNVAYLPIEVVGKNIKLKYKLINWSVFLIYRYLPYGYRILKWIRVFYKNRVKR